MTDAQYIAIALSLLARLDAAVASADEGLITVREAQSIVDDVRRKSDLLDLIDAAERQPARN